MRYLRELLFIIVSVVVMVGATLALIVGASVSVITNFTRETLYEHTKSKRTPKK